MKFIYGHWHYLGRSYAMLWGALLVVWPERRNHP